MTDSMNSRVVAVRVGEALVGIQLARVEEVTRLQNVTRVRPAPAAVQGMANLRGNLITLIDLDQVLHGHASGDQDRAITVIVDHGSESVGLVARELVDVLDAADLAQQAIPRQVTDGREGVIRSVIQLDDELLMLLDLDGLLAAISE